MSAVSLLGLLGLGTLLTGCSSEEERAYDVPKALCGVQVPGDALESLLPGGSELTVRETSPTPRTHHCEVSVDGAKVLVVSKEWAPTRGGLMTTANLNQEINDGKPKIEKDLVHTDRGAVAKVRSCVDKTAPDDPDWPDESLYTSLEAHADGVGDAAMTKELILAYAKGVEKSAFCRK